MFRIIIIRHTWHTLYYFEYFHILESVPSSSYRCLPDSEQNASNVSVLLSLLASFSIDFVLPEISLWSKNENKSFFVVFWIKSVHWVGHFSINHRSFPNDYTVLEITPIFFLQ